MTCSQQHDLEIGHKSQTEGWPSASFSPMIVLLCLRGNIRWVFFIPVRPSWMPRPPRCDGTWICSRTGRPGSWWGLDQHLFCSSLPGSCPTVFTDQLIWVLPVPGSAGNTQVGATCASFQQPPDRGISLYFRAKCAVGKHLLLLGSGAKPYSMFPKQLRANGLTGTSHAVPRHLWQPSYF